MRVFFLKKFLKLALGINLSFLSMSTGLMSPEFCIVETISSAKLCFLGDRRKIPHRHRALAEGDEITLVCVLGFLFTPQKTIH